MHSLKLPSKWFIPTSQQSCKDLDPTFTCDFALYTNATNLTEEQKLAPNPDITGYLVFTSFIVTAFSALLLSFALCLDRILYLRSKDKPSSLMESDHYHHYHHMVHSIEHWLIVLSDHQIAAGIALLVTVNGQACTISAYDYNVVCSMLLLSVIVHLTTFAIVPDYIYQQKYAATLRILSVFVQVGLALALFIARSSTLFPFDASSLAIMPAACFENTTIVDTAGLAGLIDFFSNVTTNATLTTTNTTGNGTETIWHNITAATSAEHGLVESMMLFGFFGIAITITLLQFYTARRWYKTQSPKHRDSGWGYFYSSCILILVGFIFSGYILNRYNTLSGKMQVEEWYQLAAPVPRSLSQVLPLSLFGSSILPVLHAFFGFLPHRTRRYLHHLEKQIMRTKKEVSTSLDTALGEDSE